MKKSFSMIIVFLVTVIILTNDCMISDASSDNLIDPNKIEYGYIDANDQLLRSQSHITTHYISVSPNTCIQFNTYGQGSYHRVLFYDSNKKLIDRHTARVSDYTPYTRIMRGATRYIRYSPNIDNYPYDKTYTARVVNCDPYLGKVTYSSNGNSTYSKSHSTKVTVSGHDTVKNDIQYAWSTSTTTPTSGWSNFTNGQTITRSSGTGDYYLHVKGTNWVGETFNYRSNVFRVDNTPPSHISSSIAGARYVNGSTYWVRPNDVLTVNLRQYDAHSGNKYGYIRFAGNNQDVRYHHDFEGSSTNMTVVGSGYENTSSIQVQSVDRTENSGGYGTLQWKVKLNSSGHNYAVQYYYRDKASNAIGYTTVANARVDGVAPTLNLTQNITEKTFGDVTITATASDTLSGVKRIKLPNGDWVNSSQANYKVSENGTYTFVAEDNVGNTHTQSITVNNIETLDIQVANLPTEWVGGSVTFTMFIKGGVSIAKVIDPYGKEADLKTYSDYSTVTYTVDQNGDYTFIIEDNVGNKMSYIVTVDKIDTTPPNVTITPNTSEKTHEYVTLTVNAKDNESGIKNILYIGENMVKNGDFSEGYNYWTNSGGNEGEFVLTDENTMLLQSPVNENKIKQNNAFLSSTDGATYYSEITARGNGVLNVRYGVYGSQGGSPSRDHKQEITDENNFRVYRFPIERGELSNDNLVIEKLGKQGWIEIKDIKVFEQKDITDTKQLEVALNGTYHFIVEDNAGNITRESYTVNNIEYTLSMSNPVIDDFDTVYLEEAPKIVSTNILPLYISDWRDEPNWRLSVSAEPLKLVGESFNMPVGTIKINGLSKISRLIGNGAMPTKTFLNDTILDDGAIELVRGINSRGKYELTFPEDALEVIIDPSVAKTGNYRSTITWELVSSP